LKQLLLIILFPFILFGQSQIGQDIDGEAIEDNYGRQVSMSSNGNIIAVLGDYNASDGSVRVFENVGGNWELYGTDSEGNHFGGVSASGISLTHSGTTLAIGGGGVARVFTFESGIWTQKGSDITNNTSDSSFGNIVSFSSGGKFIAISTPNYVPPSSRQNIPPPPYYGLVQIFNYESGNWNQIGNDIAGEFVAEYSSTSISLSADGSIVAISNDFTIRIYENILGVWTIKGNDIIGVQNDPKSVSLSSDGNIVAIGDSYYSDAGSQRGRVGVYKFESNDWMQIGSDIVGEAGGDRFGWSVSLSSDGNILASGGIDNDGNGDATGHVRIFKNQSGTWTQMGNSINGEGLGDHSGWSVSLSSDASTVAIGAIYNDSNGTDAGHVRVYDLGTTLSSNEFVLSKFSLFPNPTKNQFTIQLQQGLELQGVNIYNSLGQFIKSTNNNVIKTSELSTGIYYVEIITNKGKASKKIVIK